MSDPGYVPDRGHFVWIDFTPQAGREQHGHRPALVLFDLSYNRRTGLAVLCPITRQGKGYEFEVSVPPGEAVEGVVLADAVKNQDWRARGLRYAGTAPRDLVKDVLGRIAVLLGVDEYWPPESA